MSTPEPDIVPYEDRDKYKIRYGIDSERRYYWKDQNGIKFISCLKADGTTEWRKADGDIASAVVVPQNVIDKATAAKAASDAAATAAAAAATAAAAAATATAAAADSATPDNASATPDNASATPSNASARTGNASATPDNASARTGNASATPDNASATPSNASARTGASPANSPTEITFSVRVHKGATGWTADEPVIASAPAAAANHENLRKRSTRRQRSNRKQSRKYRR
jgi:hypothetical protein